MKKNATLPDAVAFAIPPPRGWKLSRIAMSIMDIPQPREPHIMGLRRPGLSSVKVGNSDPRKNIKLMTPPSSSDRFRVNPTLSCKTDVM